MHTLEPELRALHAEGAIDDDTAARELARDRAAVFSLHAELRATLYAGVLLVMGGLGIVLARHLDRIGPLAIVGAVALLTAVCAMPAARAKLAGRALSVAGDYLLLLAALLLGADLAYAEREFTLLGPGWSWHLLLLALVHACMAYVFGSSLVLTASLAALAGWFGVGSTPGDALQLFATTPALGIRALACAAVIAIWRLADRRMGSNRSPASFTDVFDHFSTNLAFFGAIAWCADWPWLAAGLPLLAVLAHASVRRGLDMDRETFLVYGVVYTAIGVCAAILPRLHGVTPSLGFLLIVVCTAAATLWGLRRQLAERAR